MFYFELHHIDELSDKPMINVGPHCCRFLLITHLSVLSLTMPPRKKPQTNPDTSTTVQPWGGSLQTAERVCHISVCLLT
jgi:hypothetical protein